MSVKSINAVLMLALAAGLAVAGDGKTDGAHLSDGRESARAKRDVSPGSRDAGGDGEERAAQTVAADAPTHPYGLRQVRRDFDYLRRTPARMDGRAWRRVGLFLAGTASLYLVREDVRDSVQDHRSPGRDRFFDRTRHLAKGAYPAGLALAFYLAGAASGEDRPRETGTLLLESEVLAFLGSVAGQLILATERPEEGDSVGFLDTGGHGVSTDVAIAASVIAPLTRRYLVRRPGEGAGRRLARLGLRTGLYGGAALVAFQRMNSDKHYLPDVVLGYATGLASGALLVRAHRQSASPASLPARLSWSLTPGPRQLWLSLRW